jgi:tetratricopeptide (TPR) repeat protein
MHPNRAASAESTAEALLHPCGSGYAAGSVFFKERGGMIQSWQFLAACMLAALAAGAAPQAKAQPRAASESLVDRIDQLIEQLGDDEFTVRERAQAELARIGVEAYDALQGAVAHEDIEVAARAQYLVRVIREDWSRAGDSPEVAELLKDYERLDDRQRRERINALAARPDSEGLSALCRIARFDKSPSMAKWAALAVITEKLPDDVDWDQRGKTILEALGRSKTAAANWLRLEVQTHSDPEKAVDEWAKIVAAEESTLSRGPQGLSNEIVVALLRRQATLLEQLKRLDDAQTAMFRMLDFERETVVALPEVMNWLIQHQRWDELDKLAERFESRLEQQPELLYLLADAATEQGDEDKAARLAERALTLNPADQSKHFQVALRLQQRDRTDWAEAEFRRVIGIGPQGSLLTFAAQSSLSEMLHDLEKHQAAAEVLAAAIAEIEKNDELRRAVDERLGREVRTLKSRLLYFEARHFDAQGDRQKKVERLDKAIATDPTDADVLIALYRLPEQDDARRQKTRDLIRKAADYYRNQIQADPEDSTPYNQFAWLVGNTEGDQSEALRHSQKSLELRPGAAGYLDTLARCYYATGDLKNALKHQEQAVELEPGSGAMKRQLQFFRQEAKKKGGEE